MINIMKIYYIKILILLIFGIKFTSPSYSNTLGIKPNIVFIMADDLGYGEISSYGCEEIQTPNIDRLAEEGMLFTDFYANAPVCSPTRIALLTGSYQQRSNVENALNYQEFGRGLLAEENTIGNELKSVGYSTGLFGKWHVGYDYIRMPLQKGFDCFFGILGGNHHYFNHIDRIGCYDLWQGNDTIACEGYTTNLITKEAINFIKNNQKRPFFLFLSHLAPHFPYIGPNDQKKLIYPNHKSWQEEEDSTVYFSMINSLDSSVGEIVKILDSLELRQKTIVVFTSDNGGAKYAPYVRNYPFRGYKGSLWEGGIRVPCIVKWPGVISPGTITNQVGITMDWYVTFCKLANVSLNKYKDGIDLTPILLGEKENIERTIYWRYRSGPGRKISEEFRAIRNGKWKLIEKYGSKDRYLFDLKNDPNESINLVNDSIVLSATLMKQLDEWERDFDLKNK